MYKHYAIHDVKKGPRYETPFFIGIAGMVRLIIFTPIYTFLQYFYNKL